MTVELVTPFSQVLRRSVPADSAFQALTGRLAFVDANGKAVAPGTQRIGLYLVLEGKVNHIGVRTEFGAGPTFLSTNAVALPMVAQTGHVALAYGIFRYKVGPEGRDPAATYNVGDLVTSDAAGRLVVVSGADADDVAFGVVEVGAGATEADITIRTLGR
jgi:hypothetical protein